jgi:N-acetylneuraminic acid mutarotase
MVRRMTRLSLVSVLSLVLVVACDPPGTNDDDSSATDAVDVITRDARPSKRSEVLAVADEASNQIVLFGGNDGPIINQRPSAAYLDDTWLFEPGLGWKEVSGDGPSARSRYAASYDPEGRRMLLFGGRWREAGTTGNYTLYNDLWAFDFVSESWTRLDDGTGPSGRYYPVSAWQDGTLYLYGGAINANALAINASSELWTWSADDGWEEQPTSGTPPSSRVFYGSAHDASRGRLILFAGQRGDFQSQAYNDLFALDLAAGAWTELDGGGNSAPFTRMHPALQYDTSRDRVMMFGGHTDIGDDNDYWVFPGDGDRWELVNEADVIDGGLGCLDNPSEVPADFVEMDLSAPERRHRGMHAILGGNLWIFGGLHAECSDHLDDTWRLDLETNSWSEVLEARSGESCLRRNDDCECLCL